jgi:hypothetical protein
MRAGGGWNRTRLTGRAGSRIAKSRKSSQFVRGLDTMTAVLGNVGRRLVEGTVGLFALLGFLYVPLGHHTGFEHARAVLSTPQAAAALEDLTKAALGLRERAVELFTSHLSPQAPTELEPPDKKAGPRPVPPKLK